jgi:hypothetical protein
VPLPDLVAVIEMSAVERYTQVHDDAPKPLVWTATTNSILTKPRGDPVATNQAVSQ